MTARRVVVTGEINGKAQVVSDSAVSAVPLLNSLQTTLWGGDSLPSFPNSGAKPDFASYFPPCGGYRFMIVTLAPDGEGETKTLSEVAGLGEEFMAAFEDPSKSALHTTDSVDFIIILSGTAGLELDDGRKVLLNPGDTLIQNGTRHAWFNPGSEPFTMAAAMIGGHPRNP